MIELRKSPFKVNKIEDDPKAFGNRPKEVMECIESLNNNRHILISGPRGIGKSSLASQIQNMYQGNNILATRCNIETNLDKYLTCYYSCDDTSSLSSIALDLIYRIEHECSWIKQFKIGEKKEFEASIDLKIFKTSLKTDIISSKPASIITQFVGGIKNIYKSLIKYTEFEGINILIDELDQIDESINLGHFFKILHEYLMHDKLDKINFILTGQKGIYSRLFNEDASIERVIKHVPISKLVKEECSHILYYAGTIAEPSFTITHDAEEFILKLSAGFPYTVQLLGDAAFASMQKKNLLTKEDVLNGLGKILTIDKNEKYYSILNQLNSEQRIVIVSSARYKSKELPMIIPIDWIISEANTQIENKAIIVNAIDFLRKKGLIILNGDKTACQFNDELFRVFLNLISSEIEEDIYGSEEELFGNEQIEFISLSELHVKRIVDEIDNSNYLQRWEHDLD